MGHAGSRGLSCVAFAAVIALVCLLIFYGCADAEARHADTEERQTGAEKPNIVFILTDDMAKGDLRYMPKTRELLAQEGTTFENAFVTYPLCCPSRATYLTGMYPHNHGVLSNMGRTGGADRFEELDREESTVATWLDAAGYRTAHFGKYLNDFNGEGTNPPPGWDHWETLVGSFHLTGQVHECDQSAGCRVRTYDPVPNWEDHFAPRVKDFVRGAQGPFYAQVGTHAPHAPYKPPARHAERFEDVAPPRAPSLGEADVSDKPGWVRDEGPLTRGKRGSIAEGYRGRLRSLLAVDDMVGEVVKALEESGELSNTFIFFSSDNGYHFGEHGLRGKWTPYEEAIRVPLVVRGPDVPAGETRDEMVLNNDLAPTFADLGGTGSPPFVDGRSLEILLSGGEPLNWRTRFLVEGWHERLSPTSPPTYEAIRTPRHLYVEYETGERELYNLARDPHQLESLHRTRNRALLTTLDRGLSVLASCKEAGCRTAEEGRSGSR